jgi:hypothetical protein
MNIIEPDQKWPGFSFSVLFRKLLYTHLFIYGNALNLYAMTFAPTLILSDEPQVMAASTLMSRQACSI